MARAPWESPVRPQFHYQGPVEWGGQTAQQVSQQLGYLPTVFGATAQGAAAPPPKAQAPGVMPGPIDTSTPGTPAPPGTFDFPTLEQTAQTGTQTPADIGNAAYPVMDPAAGGYPDPGANAQGLADFLGSMGSLQQTGVPGQAPGGATTAPGGTTTPGTPAPAGGGAPTGGGQGPTGTPGGGAPAAKPGAAAPGAAGPAGAGGAGGAGGLSPQDAQTLRSLLSNLIGGTAGAGTIKPPTFQDPTQAFTNMYNRLLTTQESQQAQEAAATGAAGGAPLAYQQAQNIMNQGQTAGEALAHTVSQQNLYTEQNYRAQLDQATQQVSEIMKTIEALKNVGGGGTGIGSPQNAGQVSLPGFDPLGTNSQTWLNNPSPADALALG